MKLSFALLVAAAVPLAASQPAPDLMPVPEKAVFGNGALRVDGSFSVGFALKPAARLERGAARMVRELSLQTGIPLRTPAGSPAPQGTLIIDCRETADV